MAPESGDRSRPTMLQLAHLGAAQKLSAVAEESTAFTGSV